MSRHLVVDLDHEALNPMVPRWFRVQANTIDASSGPDLESRTEQPISKSLRYLAELLEDAYAVQPAPLRDSSRSADGVIVGDELIEQFADGLRRKLRRQGRKVPGWLR